MSLISFTGHERLPLVRQTEAAECGLACLAMIASYHGHRIDLNTLRRRYPVSLNGVTLRSLIQVASQLHLVGRPLRLELEHLGNYRVTKGEIAKFASSPGTMRGFCRTCGSTLTCEVSALPGETHFHVGAFEAPEQFQPG